MYRDHDFFRGKMLPTLISHSKLVTVHFFARLVLIR